MDEQEPTPAPEEPSEQEPQPAATPPEMPQPPPPPAPPRIDPFGYLTKAWNLVIGNGVLLIVGFLVVMALCCIPLANLVLIGPLMFGYLRVVDKRLRDEPAEFGEIFSGFQDFGKGFLTVLLLMALSLALGVLITIGVLLMFIPCVGWVLGPALMTAASLVFGAAVYFVMPIAALSDASPVEAVQRSIKFCFANFWQVLLLSLVMGFVAGAGSLVCGVGTIFTVPLSLAGAVAAYHEFYLPNAPQGE